MENMGIFSQSALYFAAPFLAKALGCNLYVTDTTITDPYDLGSPVFAWKPGARINRDNIIIIGANALFSYQDQLKNHKSVAVIFSDTNCAREYIAWTKICNENNVAVYAMPDLMQYTTGLRRPAVPVYHAITLPLEMAPRADHNMPVICHSPGAKAGSNAKGTAQIETILQELSGKYNFSYKKLTGLCWRECIAQKMQADIFIDQLIYGNPGIDQSRWGNDFVYNGGLGKSGLEAMLAGCCVVTGAPMPLGDNWPPVFYESASTIKDRLESLLTWPQMTKICGGKQKAWAEMFCSPDFVARRVTEHIC